MLEGGSCLIILFWGPLFKTGLGLAECHWGCTGPRLQVCMGVISKCTTTTNTNTNTNTTTTTTTTTTPTPTPTPTPTRNDKRQTTNDTDTDTDTDNVKQIDIVPIRRTVEEVVEVGQTIPQKSLRTNTQTHKHTHTNTQPTDQTNTNNHKQTQTCGPHALGSRQCGEQRGPDLKHSETQKNKHWRNVRRVYGTTRRPHSAVQQSLSVLAPRLARRSVANHLLVGLEDLWRSFHRQTLERGLSQMLLTTWTTCRWRP